MFHYPTEVSGTLFVKEPQGSLLNLTLQKQTFRVLFYLSLSYLTWFKIHKMLEIKKHTLRQKSILILTMVVNR